MTELWGNGRLKSAWRDLREGRVVEEGLALVVLGGVSWLVFAHARAFTAGEATLLILATSILDVAVLRWWHWHRRLTQGGALVDGLNQILAGGREPLPACDALAPGDRRVAEALNALLAETKARQEELGGLRHAADRDWRELDALLGAIQSRHEEEWTIQIRGKARLESLGRELKRSIEGALQLEEVELNYRLRADQSRLQGAAFRSALDQVRSGLEQFENLLEELQDTFPRLRREEDALGRLGDAALRQSARLALSVKGLVAHTPRLIEDNHSRTEGLRRLRAAADGVRDQTEALARRLDGFREEAQARIHAFSGAQGALTGLDHVAQQTGLLAVNAAILAQQDSGSAGMAVIGGRLRHLADRTVEGAASMERTLGEYQRGLEHEATSLWDLQEATQSLLSEVHELLRTTGQMDLQGRDLELVLEAHLGLVDQTRQAADRAELSMHEIGARAMAMEAAHARQWSVEAKLTPEQERISRLGQRLDEVGTELAHLNQQNIDELWDILARHQELRRNEAYRQVVSDGFTHLLDLPEQSPQTWNGIAWARARRRPRLVGGGDRSLPPQGRRHADGSLRLRLLGQDALQGPEASALEAWSCDSTGQAWSLNLLPSLRTESHRLALLALLKESPVADCFQGLEMRISPGGIHLQLPHPYPGLPSFLAGLGLELIAEPDLQEHPFRAIEALVPRVQCVAWSGPGLGGGLRSPAMRLVHGWVRDVQDHASFLPWLPYGGQRPRCPWLGDPPADTALELPLAVRCLDLGAETGQLQSFMDRFLEAGACEGPTGITLCSVGIGHAHPEALLLRLFQPDAELAGAFHPDLVPYQIRLREEVLGGATGDPYQAAWALLEDLQREGWLIPIPPL